MINQLGVPGVSHIRFTIRKLFGVENQIREFLENGFRQERKLVPTRTETRFRQERK